MLSSSESSNDCIIAGFLVLAGVKEMPLLTLLNNVLLNSAVSLLRLLEVEVGVVPLSLLSIWI
jgi:hypothetical protein